MLHLDEQTNSFLPHLKIVFIVALLYFIVSCASYLFGYQPEWLATSWKEIACTLIVVFALAAIIQIDTSKTQAINRLNQKVEELHTHLKAFEELACPFFFDAQDKKLKKGTEELQKEIAELRKRIDEIQSSRL